MEVAAVLLKVPPVIEKFPPKYIFDVYKPAVFKSKIPPDNEKLPTTSKIDPLLPTAVFAMRKVPADCEKSPFTLNLPLLD